MMLEALNLAGGSTQSGAGGNLSQLQPQAWPVPANRAESLGSHATAHVRNEMVSTQGGGNSTVEEIEERTVRFNRGPSAVPKAVSPGKRNLENELHEMQNRLEYQSEISQEAMSDQRRSLINEAEEHIKKEELKERALLQTSAEKYKEKATLAFQRQLDMTEDKIQRGKSSNSMECRMLEDRLQETELRAQTIVQKARLRETSSVAAATNTSQLLTSAAELAEQNVYTEKAQLDFLSRQFQQLQRDEQKQEEQLTHWNLKQLITGLAPAWMLITR